MLALFSVASTAQALTPIELVVEEWETWKAEFGKNYSQQGLSAGEERQTEHFRMKIWMENKAYIERHNRLAHMGLKSFFVGMNQFGDLLTHEVNAMMNGAIPPRSESNDTVPLRGAKYLPPAHVSSFPESVDWRTRGAVTPVKDQGQCGSCWAFSATGALEAMHYRATGVLTSLSEQNLIDCNRRSNGCGGGLATTAFQYIKDNRGIDTENSYPYEAKNNRCRYNPRNKGASDYGFKVLPRGNEYYLKTAIATQGPCSVSIDANHQSFQFYRGGVYREAECSSVNHDHAVLVVGYGVDKASGSAYWLVKNSYWTTWGERGYIRIAKDENNMCGIASHASYPLV